MDKKLYFYDGKTTEFLYGKEINASFGTSIPNTTEKEPLELKEGFAVCFNKEQDNWEYIEDNRNKIVYETSTKQKQKVDYLGVIKSEHTLLVPKKFDKWDEALKSWVEDSELVKKHEESEPKTKKETELNELVIDHNKVLYDANQEALGNMATVVAIANATFNKAIAVGFDGNGAMSLEDAYKYVYKNQTVTWKGADNKPHTVQLESLVEAAQTAMTKKSQILFKY